MTVLLSPGPPPLTDDAAQAVLDLVDLTAATARGVDTIDITDPVRAIWLQQVTFAYPYLAPPVRVWMASAPETLRTVTWQLSQLSPPDRAALGASWTPDLPWMLQLIAPALQAGGGSLAPAVSSDAAAADELTRQTLAELDEERRQEDLRGTPLPVAPSEPAAAVDPVQAAQDHVAASRLMEAGSYRMMVDTMGMINAINGMSGH
ncbi:hypothetical protein [Microbacterium deminutum]|uniref:Uncharacterized protein n=1 Tax=Microbacterium deminutum TaxID=344164 RepID=A0ABN2Q9R4_9MICO